MDLNEILTMKPELLTIAFLNAMGVLLKNTPKVSDKYIPLLLALFGACAQVGRLGLTTENVMAGVMLGAGAVFANQVYRQLKPTDPTPPAQPKEDPKP